MIGGEAVAAAAATSAGDVTGDYDEDERPAYTPSSDSDSTILRCSVNLAHHGAAASSRARSLLWLNDDDDDDDDDDEEEEEGDDEDVEEETEARGVGGRGGRLIYASHAVANVAEGVGGGGGGGRDRSASASAAAAAPPNGR